ncbi:MAG: poly-gamma-glutamate biosynthesis protein PgsC [Fusobacteriaceae bacterium]
MNETIIVLGVILSIAFYEIYEMSPGGMIVPGYFALFSNDYKRMIITVLVSLAVLGIGKLLEKHIILYGRRKFAIYVILTFVLKIFIRELDVTVGGDVIGILIPAILAQDIDKNSIGKTLPALIILTIVIKSIIMISTGAI